jgi:hypothetical protein
VTLGPELTKDRLAQGEIFLFFPLLLVVRI